MAAYVVEEDIRRWEREGRHDIIARLRNDDVIWAGDRMIGRSGRKVATCFYLGWRGPSFFCGIYDTRPLVCRNYIPGSSAMCPRYYEGRHAR
jgi:Fe-S-cluster containining protein